MWPSHYPTQCPPEEAFTYEGSLYRFINRNNPVPKDFKSYYETKIGNDWGDKACQARGLSVFKTLDDCSEMMRTVPALRKKKVAVATIDSECGLLANTPSTKSKRHCTWWIPKSLSNPCELFEKIDLSEMSHA